MAEVIVTLCKENDSETKYYPNIKSDNIPSKAISENKLDDNLQEKLNRTYPDVYNKAETDALLDDKADVDDVYTKTETNTLLDNKADVDDVYTKTETNTLLDNKANKNNIPFENIKDADGNNRFIEGLGIPATISGVTSQYNRWSLSGTHLMIVLALKIDANATLSNYAFLDEITLPTWIMNKISTLGGESSAWVSIKSVNIHNENGTLSGVTNNFLLEKNPTSLKIYNITTDYTPTENKYVRIQFDLLIDNA